VVQQLFLHPREGEFVFLFFLQWVDYTGEREIVQREGDGAFIGQAPSLQKEGKSMEDLPTHDTKVLSITFRNLKKLKNITK